MRTKINRVLYTNDFWGIRDSSSGLKIAEKSGKIQKDLAADSEGPEDVSKTKNEKSTFAAKPSDSPDSPPELAHKHFGTGHLDAQPRHTVAVKAPGSCSYCRPL